MPDMLAMTNMDSRTLGTSGLRISELCLGTSNFGGLTPEAECRQVLDAYASTGGNFIDVADVYNDGAAEEILGRLLKGRRDDFVVLTKFGMQTAAAAKRYGGSRRAIASALDASLRRLQTDCIDMFMMHVPDPDTPLDETIAALDGLVRDGKLRTFGISNFAGWQVAKGLGLSALHRWARYAALEAQYSLVAREAEFDLLPLCREESLPLIAYAPLGGGVLSGKYDPARPPPAGTRLADLPAHAHGLNSRTLAVVEALHQVAAETGRTAAAVALRWVADQAGVASVLIGARTAQQLRSNLEMLGWKLTPEHLRVLDKASRPRLIYPHDLQNMLGCRR